MTSFERRLYTGFGILVLLFTPLLVGAFIVISELENTQGQLLSKNGQDVIKAERLNSFINEEFALVQAFVLRGAPNAIEQLDQVHRDFQSTASDLLIAAEPDEPPALLQEIKRLENDVYEFSQRSVQLKKEGATIADLNSYFESKNITRGARILQLVRENVSIQSRQLRQARTHADQLTKRLVWGLITACAFALIATMAIVVLLVQMIRGKAREDQRRDEKLRLEQELSTARKEVVEVVAHDLKNPLSSLRMSIELLKDDLRESGNLSGDLSIGFQIAERSIESMRRLIEDQLDHTKIEAGQLVLERSIVNLSEMINDLGLRYQPLAEDKELRLSTRADRSLFANVDAARFEQVLSNLIGNALKFTPAGGSIELIGERRGSLISVRVKDNGHGIDREAIKHIFERYWQVRETSKKGTGLGLSIAKGIVDAHGGKISCQSEPGRGSTFEVLIPAATLARSPEITH